MDGGAITLQVSNIPPYLREEEFSRLFMQLEGCTGSRLQQTTAGLKGMVDFSSTAAAQQAFNLYNGWQGWGPRGLSMEFLPSSTATPQPQQTSQQPQSVHSTGMVADVNKDIGMGQGNFQQVMDQSKTFNGGQMTQMGGQQAAPMQNQLQGQPQQRPMQTPQQIMPQQQGGMLGGMQGGLPQLQQGQGMQSSLGAGMMGTNGTGFQPMLGGGAGSNPNTLNVQQLLQQAQSQQQQQLLLGQGQGGMSPQQQLLLAMQNAGGVGAGPNPTPMSNTNPVPMLPNVQQDQQMMLPKNAANTLFCEGLPLDATEREVAHIFRPFEGFKEVRLIERENKQATEGKVKLGFFEFKNASCANAALNVIQGYQFDQKNPEYAMKLSFAKYPTKRRQENRSDRGNRSKRRTRDDH